MKSMYRDFGNSLIDPKYCCVAIPLVNAGIYAILLEQAVVSMAVGVMVFATPSVVGAYFPSFAGVILAICCFIVAGLQPVGFVGVSREKTSTYRWYSLLNILAVLAAFATAAGLIISSAISHNPAVNQCRIDYFTATKTPTGLTAGAANATLSAQADTLCPAFAWADVGIMGGIWLLLLLTQGYFLYASRKYGTSQVSDHKLYHSVYSENPEAFTMSVLRSSRYNPGSVYSQNPQAPRPSGLGTRSVIAGDVGAGGKDDVWDHRASTESLRDDKYVDNQHQAYPSGSGGAYNHAGIGGGAGNRESRYEDAYDERAGYGYDQGQGQAQAVPYGGGGQGYGHEENYGSYPQGQGYEAHGQHGHGQGQGQGYGYVEYAIPSIALGAGSSRAFEKRTRQDISLRIINSSGSSSGADLPTLALIQPPHPDRPQLRRPEHNVSQLTAWQAEYDTSVDLVKLLDKQQKLPEESVYRRHELAKKILSQSRALEDLSYRQQNLGSSHDQLPTGPEARLFALHRQARRRVLCDRDEPMSQAGMLQASMVSADEQLWPKNPDYYEHNRVDFFTNPGQLSFDQIDQETSAWRELRSLAHDLVSAVRTESSQFTDSSGNAVGDGDLRISNLRDRIASYAAQSLGFDVSTAENPEVVDGLAGVSRYMDDNQAPTPESALHFLESVCNHGEWDVDVQPFEAFLESVVEKRRPAFELYDSCKAYTDNYHSSARSTGAPVDMDEKSGAMARIRKLASTLEPGSHIPAATNGNSSWGSECLDLYASYVSRLNPDELHSALRRDVISRFGHHLKSYAPLSAFMAECDLRQESGVTD